MKAVDPPARPVGNDKVLLSVGGGMTVGAIDVAPGCRCDASFHHF